MELARFFCADGVSLRIDCSEFGSHCAADQTGKIDCVPNGTACTDATADTCDNNAIKQCVNGTFEETPCMSIGLTSCVSTGNDTVKCN